jgi:hypothetical protein
MIVLAARVDRTEPLVWSALTLFSADEPAPEPLDEDTGIAVW